MHAKQRFLGQNYMSPWIPALICDFWKQNIDFWTRITNLYRSQTSPFLLCMQNIVICTRIWSLYGFQLSSVVFACKTATSRPDLHICKGSKPHPWFWAHITASLASELIVSMDPSPPLWFMLAKQRLLDQTYKSLRLPDLTCRFLQGIHHA